MSLLLALRCPCRLVRVMCCTTRPSRYSLHDRLHWSARQRRLESGKCSPGAHILRCRLYLHKSLVAVCHHKQGNHGSDQHKNAAAAWPNSGEVADDLDLHAECDAWSESHVPQDDSHLVAQPAPRCRAAPAYPAVLQLRPARCQTDRFHGTGRPKAKIAAPSSPLSPPGSLSAPDHRAEIQQHALEAQGEACTQGRPPAFEVT